MKKMISTKKLRYDGKRIAVGDVISVRDDDVLLLRALGWVTDMSSVNAMSTENTSSLVPTPTRHSAVTSTSPPARHHLTEQITTPSTSKSILDVVSTDDTETEESKVEAETEVDMSTTQELTQYTKMLRERARNLGIRVDYRWSDERVQREIDEYNKRTYQHMDMRSK